MEFIMATLREYIFPYVFSAMLLGCLFILVYFVIEEFIRTRKMKKRVKDFRRSLKLSQGEKNEQKTIV